MVSAPDSVVLPANRFARYVYLVGLIFTVFPGPWLGRSGWVALATGGAYALLGLGPILTLAVVAWRFVYVVRHREALASPAGHPVAAFVQWLGVFVISVGAIGSIAVFFGAPLTRWLFRGNVGEDGIAYFVVGLGLLFITSATIYGLALFELGRGLAYAARHMRPAHRRLVAAGTLILAVGTPVFWRTHADMELKDVHAARAAFDKACNTVPAPVVHTQFVQPVTSILVAQDTRDDRLNLQPINLALAREFEFVEGCYTGEHCERYENRHRARSTAEVNHGSIPAATARIRFAIAERRIVKDVHGARLVEMKYEIADTQNSQRLAEATELVFDWGRWAAQRGNKRYGSELEACGYASRVPIDFRPNVFGVVEPYLKTDLAFLHSALPELKVEADSSQAIPAEPPQATPAEPPPPVAPAVPAPQAPRISSDPHPAVAVNAVQELQAEYHGPVHLQPLLQGNLTEGGRTFGYCCAGAFAAALASSPARGSRSYAEATFLAQDGEQMGGTYTNVGVTGGLDPADRVGATLMRDSLSALPFPQGKRLRSGDTIGVLMDRGTGVVDFFLNGNPLRSITPPPGADWTLWVSASSPKSKNGSTDRWTLNFGTETFLFPPVRALTYEGARISKTNTGR